MLSLHDVEVTFPSGRRAVRRVSLRLERGSFTVLLGRSGAGKSTLLRCLNGLVVPTAGWVQVEGLGALEHPGPLRAHRRRTAMVFQQHQLMGRLTAYRNVLIGRLAHHGPLRSLLPLPVADRELALGCLDRVGLVSRALSRVDEMSGGEQQRVGVARALAQQPALLLGDEPVASLDPATAVQILDLLRAVCRERDITALVSLHQLDLARRFGDRIVGLAAGEVVFDGGPDQLTAAAVTRIYESEARS